MLCGVAGGDQEGDGAGEGESASLAPHAIPAGRLSSPRKVSQELAPERDFISP